MNGAATIRRQAALPETLLGYAIGMVRRHLHRELRMIKNVGMLLLAIWLIITGLIPLLKFSFSGLGTIMAILAIAAGALIIVGR